MKDNKLIAEFMGWKLQDNPTERWYGSYREPNGILHKNTDKEPLLFHTCWNWLIPVVDKCWKSGAEENEVGDITHAYLDCDIDKTYKAVVEFIKQLNKEQ